MKKSLFLVLFFLSCFLYACSSTEIDKNPTPIVWGEVSFFPSSTEKSSNKFILNNIKFSGYGHSGLIDQVIITSKETVIENINSDFYSARKLVLKDIKGDYKEAFIFLLSGQYRKFKKKNNLSQLPQINISSWESSGEKWIDKDLTVSCESGKAQNVSFTTVNNYESTNIKAIANGVTGATINKASIKRLLIPDDVNENPENIILEKLNLDEIKIPRLEATIKELSLNYKEGQLNFAVENASIPGAVLAQFDIPKAPEVVQGSLTGSAQVKGEMLSGDATLDLTNLLSATANITGGLASSMPDILKFSLTDKGLVNYLTEDTKAQLAMLSLFIPNGQLALVGFLSKPDQTLTGVLDFTRDNPDFQYQLK